MPYVLKHRDSGEIATAILKNSYDLNYFGTQWWDTEEEVEEHKLAFLRQWQYDDEMNWESYYVEEQKLKLMNVKLKNNPAFMLILDDDGSIKAKLRAEST